MSEENKKSQKLFSVAKEFNLGVETIVSFLKGKGFNDIQNNLNQKINPEMYGLLVREYAADKKTKERANEVTEKFKTTVKEIKQPAILKLKTIPKPLAPEVKEEKTITPEKEPDIVVEKEPERIPVVIEVPEIIVEKEPEIPQIKTQKEVIEPEIIPEIVVEKEPETITEKTSAFASRIKGKIDLPEKSTKTRKEIEKEKKEKAKKEKDYKIEQERQRTAKILEQPQPKEIIPVQEIKTQIIVEKEPEKIINLFGEEETITSKTAKKKKPKGKFPEVETQEDEPIITEKEPEIITEKTPEIPEQEEVKTIRASDHSPQLKGLTIKGKIDLPLPTSSKGKKGKKGDPKLQKNSTGGTDITTESQRRRKRKRKVAAKVTLNQPNQQQTGTKPDFQRRPNQQQTGQFNRGQKPTGTGTPKTEIDKQAIQSKVKQTFRSIKGSSPNKSKIKRKENIRRKEDNRARAYKEQLEQAQILEVTEYLTANELATLMNVTVQEVIGKCMELGFFVSINQRISADVISIVSEEFGFQTKFISAEEATTEVEVPDAPETLQPRPPIVTVMGHVDHGKTSLLDYVRKTNIIAGEAGGITQHIGAYEVTLENGRNITFLDTPGHEAFTAMRARGAQITDLAIIVIAADDQIMPQTREAINHAQAGNVPMLFAINKIDKPGAQAEKIREQLSQMNILVEDWGGKFQCQEISAKSGKGIPELLEKVLLEADLLDLKANPDRLAKGVVIEAEVDKGRGIVTTILVQTGTLKIGDMILVNSNYGKVKAILDERQKRVKKAGPSVPVQILGLNGVPQAGDKFQVLETEAEARALASKRQLLEKEKKDKLYRKPTLQDVALSAKQGKASQLNLIIKGDVDGSIEALADSLLKISTAEVSVNILLKAVGQISESDVLLATASNALIIGFQVRPSSNARKLAEQSQIEIRLYSVIYDAINEIKDALEGMLKPKIEETITGVAEVREVFKITKVGAIAGCLVVEGKINRATPVRLIRDGVVIYSGKISSLKRFKDDAKEVTQGTECGIGIENYNDLKVGDNIEAYTETEIKRTLLKKQDY